MLIDDAHVWYNHSKFHFQLIFACIYIVHIEKYVEQRSGTNLILEQYELGTDTKEKGTTTVTLWHIIKGNNSNYSNGNCSNICRDHVVTRVTM